jgi:hypothetical protein
MTTATLVVKSKFFKSLKAWDDLFAEASEFASKVGRERLINISHSHTGFEGVVAVWYWGETGDE